jgi:hypothetical protein
MWSLSLSSDGGRGQWTELHPVQRPSARFSASSTVVKDTLYMFGGQDSSQAFLSDLWAYDQDTKEWRALQPSGLEKDRSAAPHPPARAGHALSPIDDTHLLVSPLPLPTHRITVGRGLCSFSSASRMLRFMCSCRAGSGSRV